MFQLYQMTLFHKEERGRNIGFCLETAARDLLTSIPFAAHRDTSWEWNVSMEALSSAVKVETSRTQIGQSVCARYPRLLNSTVT
jgi:hypothetical protein